MPIKAPLTQGFLITPLSLLALWWWLVLIVMVILITFEWNVSLGDVLSIVIPVVLAAIATTLIWIRRLWLRAHPFIMRYSQQPLDSPGAFEQNLTFTRKQIVHMTAGKHRDIFVAVWPRNPISLESFDLRLVERKYDFDRRWWGHFWRNTPASMVTIDNLTIPSWERRKRNYTALKEEVSTGIYVDTPDRWLWPTDEPLWLKIDLIAQHNWSGFLSFRSHSGIGRRGYVRLPLTVCYR